MSGAPGGTNKQAAIDYGKAVASLKRAAAPGVPSLNQAFELADKLGIHDSYAFAELLIWDLEHYGKFAEDAFDQPETLSELESAFTEAQDHWDRRVAK